MKNRDTLLAKVNAAEEHMDRLLKRSQFVYQREYACRCNGRDYFIDFVVLGYGLGIEIDGRDHFKPTGQAADRIREKAILDSGEVLHILRLSWSRALAIKTHSELDELMTAAANIGRGVVLCY